MSKYLIQCNTHNDESLLLDKNKLERVRFSSDKLFVAITPINLFDIVQLWRCVLNSPGRKDKRLSYTDRKNFRHFLAKYLAFLCPMKNDFCLNTCRHFREKGKHEINIRLCLKFHRVLTQTKFIHKVTSVMRSFVIEFLGYMYQMNRPYS